MPAQCVRFLGDELAFLMHDLLMSFLLIKKFLSCFHVHFIFRHLFFCVRSTFFADVSSNHVVFSFVFLGVRGHVALYVCDSRLQQHLAMSLQFKGFCSLNDIEAFDRDK